MTTGQLAKPAGRVLAFAGRPVDLLASPDGRTLFVKTGQALLVLDTATFTLRQTLSYEENSRSSMHGLALAPGGEHLYLTLAGGHLAEARRQPGGTWRWTRRIPLPSHDQGSSYPCGLAIGPGGRQALVALSRSNQVMPVNLESGRAGVPLPAGTAPYGIVLAAGGRIAYVSNWGGRRPRDGERTMLSSGTPVLVDETSHPASGTVMKLDLETGRVLAETETGLHPAQLLLSPGGESLFVANANSDTVTILETAALKVREQISIRPEASLPFGSLPDALALSPDGRTLYAANAGNNAIAVIALGDGTGPGRVTGFIPAGWFPAALAMADGRLFVANAKGEGSRQPVSGQKKWHVRQERGTVQQVELAGPEQLGKWTGQAHEQALVPQILRAFQPGQPGRKPVPVPRRPGEPSVFKHVVYVIKENRTYDQVFGDLPRGNGDPALCIYGREVTPNHHALAEEFVLLDNYYCSGIVSADGHQWATQGITTDYQEKTFGEWTRSYDFGSDPLAFAPTPFLWDHALLRGLSFRNYGEFDFPELIPASAGWSDWYRDHTTGTKTVRFVQNVPPAALRAYTAPDYPGWQMQIPDVYRVERFLAEFREYEKTGLFPSLVVVYLPQDHTQGLKAGVPTPRAHVADNDLALGRLVEAISRSRFWKETCIFVNEDDPQDGFDHVDGHRSLCLVASPFTKRGKVISRFYNQGSVLHTMERMLGLPPMNQLDAAAPLMTDCFTSRPDFRPYSARPNRIPLDEMNPASMAGEPFRNAGELSARMDLSRPDRIGDDAWNRILWLAARGPDVPYPAHLAGAHGRGLAKLKLRPFRSGADSD